MRTVWILGAGASKSHCSQQKNKDFPLINDFFKIAKDDLNILTDKENKIKKEYKFLHKYIIKRFRIDISDTPNLNIEKLLTMIEIEIEKSNLSKYQDLKDDILNIIREVLNSKSKEIKVKKGEYKKLIEIINPEEDTIISFNWDLLLDNIFNRKEILPEKPSARNLNGKSENIYYKSMYHLTSYKKGTFGGLTPPKPYRNYKAGGYYLKLHGSIDWIYCSNKTCSEYRRPYPVKNFMDDYFCGVCHEKMENLIIPPVLKKNYNSFSFIRSLWNRAAKEIENANKLIIWGYSLPPTDIYSKWLLRQTQSNLQKVIIINPDAVIRGEDSSDVKWNKKFVDKFVDIFWPLKKPNDTKIEFYFEFDDYIKNKKIDKDRPPEKLEDTYNYNLLNSGDEIDRQVKKENLHK